jgi:hypothetical protein
MDPKLHSCRFLRYCCWIFGHPWLLKTLKATRYETPYYASFKEISLGSASTSWKSSFLNAERKKNSPLLTHAQGFLCYWSSSGDGIKAEDAFLGTSGWWHWVTALSPVDFAISNSVSPRNCLSILSICTDVIDNQVTLLCHCSPLTSLT